ncbi:PTH2-domain-containing protein [Rhizoclosmatium globosum]|uniref:peptidyl-tRNA hydrolase n=1 Tax=Rhizoclosmatium globosum TaxID=329046 RepID=A0A1Y2ALA8_9FUNG|nr:PTH2-domain-containing protein [Rhizoclosmatium globosum]|eukprot:ORY23341.1 PTH2-domain-containing protein [Rhizoclosmatium globosum]
MEADALVSFLSTPSFTGIDLLTASLVSLAFAFVVFYATWSTAESVASANAKLNSPSEAKDEKKPIEEKTEEVESEDDEDDESDDEDTNANVPLLSKTYSGPGEWKMVLLVRTDLDMGKGKAAAQCCHATLAAYRKLKQRIRRYDPAWAGLRNWERYGQAKVTLKCPNEEEMLALQKKARSLGLVAESIRDAGRTQIAANSRTVLAVGPGPKKVVDEVCGHLKLY